MTATALVLEFVDAISKADIEAIDGLMATDHLFIDSDGTEVRGRDKMREGWIGYFSMFPDYRIEVLKILADAGTVVLVGNAAGTYSPDGRLNPEDRWKVPAAWRAVVRRDRADKRNKLPLDCLQEMIPLLLLIWVLQSSSVAEMDLKLYAPIYYSQIWCLHF